MRRKAFTVLEVLMVITLLAVIAAIAWPDFFQSRRHEQLDESGRRLRTLIQMCRAQAMNETRRYCLAFFPDGSIELLRQRDPILAPHQYFRFREPWADIAILLEDVWVESILPLPEGPPPLDIRDELIEFRQFQEEPTPISDLEAPFMLYFEPDGISRCVQWTLRAETGRGLKMTLDGRLGRVKIESAEDLAEGFERPDRSPTSKESLEFEEIQPELEQELPT